MKFSTFFGHKRDAGMDLNQFDILLVYSISGFGVRNVIKLTKLIPLNW